MLRTVLAERDLVYAAGAPAEERRR